MFDLNTKLVHNFKLEYYLIVKNFINRKLLYYLYKNLNYAQTNPSQPCSQRLF